MTKNAVRKYLPYFIFGAIILMLGGLLAWRELRNTPRNDVKTTTTAKTKAFNQQTVTTKTTRLLNGKTVTIEFQLTDVTAIENFVEFGDGASNRYVYNGKGQIQVFDSDTSDKKKVLDTYYINSLDYHLPQLSCILNQELMFGDFNNDKNPDFIIGQFRPYSSPLMYLYSIDPNGKISRLDTNGPVILTSGFSFYNGVILNGSNSYYRWNKTKFDQKEVSVEIIPMTYSKDDVSNLLFHYSFDPTITFNSCNLLESKSSISYECKRNFMANSIEISAIQNDKLVLSYTYYFDANSIEQKNPPKDQNQKLNLSDEQLIDLANRAREILDYSLNEFGLPELTK